MITHYAGIGARNITEKGMSTIKMLSRIFADTGFVLRSGAASGADNAWESAYMLPPKDRQKEIYLPWGGFNARSFAEMGTVNPSIDKWEEAYDMAARYHPNWGVCSAGSKKLLARNCFQLFGADLDTPSDFVVAWTKDGATTGGTGQAIRLAQAYNIPVYNLGSDEMTGTKIREVLLSLAKERFSSNGMKLSA